MRSDFSTVDAASPKSILKDIVGFPLLVTESCQLCLTKLETSLQSTAV